MNTTTFIFLFFNIVVPAFIETSGRRIFKNETQLKTIKVICGIVAVLGLTLFLITSNSIFLNFVIPIYQLFVYNLLFKKFHTLFGRFPKTRWAIGTSGNPFKSLKNEMKYRLKITNKIEEIPDRLYYWGIGFFCAIPIFIFVVFSILT